MKKILVPIDGSAASEKAAEKAVEIAKNYGSTITFVNVINVSDLYKLNHHGGFIEMSINTMTEQMKNNGEKMLESVTGNIDCSGINCEKIVVSGQPEEEILKAANDGSFDLIVMGRRGFSKIKRFFIGSVTQRVISDSPCPILIINE